MHSDLFQSLSQPLAHLVEEVGQSLVRIETRRGPGKSGVVWAEGLIVTADHNLEDDEAPTVTLADGRGVSAEIVGRDPGTDVALLRVGTPGLRPAPFDDLDQARVGHLLLALSRPGRTVRATCGILSTLGEGFRTAQGGRVERYLHADLPLYPGYSGGALVDLRGQVLGITTSALVRGASLAIPTVTLRRVTQALLAEGQVRRGYLGIGTHPVDLPAAIAAARGQPRGLLVLSVQPGSPADQAGLLLGDALLELDGARIGGLSDLFAVLDGERVGQQVALTLLRAGALTELTLRVGAR